MCCSLLRVQSSVTELRDLETEEWVSGDLLCSNEHNQQTMDKNMGEENTGHRRWRGSLEINAGDEHWR